MTQTSVRAAAPSKRIALALALAALVPGRLAHAAGDVSAQLDALVAPSFAARQPGAVVLVTKDNRVLLRKAYGMADLELDVPMRPELIFRLGSITKQLTAAAIMLLVEQHKLSLQDDVRKLVPGYPAHGHVVTLEQLLTHTAGVPSYTDIPSVAQHAREDLTREQLLALFKDLPLEFTPGEKWKYSNSGYYLLGMAIEKASGMSYAQFLDENIFKPLGMLHTSYGDTERIIPGRTTGYDREGDRVRNAEPISMALPFAAGGLVSNVDDLARWDGAIAAGKLLSKEGWARIFTAQKLSDGSSAHYGFGWSIGSWHGHRVVAHGGAIPGFNTNITRLPDDHVLVVILCNSGPAPTNLEGLGIKLAATAIGSPIVAPKAVAVDQATLDRYVGVYQDEDKRRWIVRRNNDHLLMERTGGGLQFQAMPESTTSFFVPDSLLRVAFVVDGGGRVTALEITKPDGVVARHARSDEPMPAAPKAVTLPPKQLDGYVGGYELRPGFVIAITREGARMFAQATGQPRFELLATAPDEFSVMALAAQLSFHVDGAGRADSVVLHQNGHDMPGKRVP